MKKLAARALVLAASATCATAVHAAHTLPTVFGADEVLARRHLPPGARAGYLAAAALLQRRLIVLRTYPHIHKRCLAFELEDIEGKSYYFAARGICSSSPSSLLDRYWVDVKARHAFLYDELKESYSLLPERRRKIAAVKASP